MRKIRTTFQNKTQGGYMLVEILVSLMIFTIVAVSSAGALLAIIDADSKAQNMRAVMDNLSVAVENISRSIRIGTDYQCVTVPDNLSGSVDANTCGPGTIGVSFLPQDSKDSTDRIEYYFDSVGNAGNGRIRRYRPNQIGGSGNAVDLTAPEVKLNDVKFYVDSAGATAGQARVFIDIAGQAGITGSKTQSLFNIQTTVSERFQEAQ
jgi:type II secretory pathway pseudopilin PulG